MTNPIILASGSKSRQEMLRSAGVVFTSIVAQIDEGRVKTSLLRQDASPHDIADALADLKARHVSQENPDSLVIGCDQILEFGHAILSKPRTRAEAIDQLTKMSGKKHKLLSAVVIYKDNQPVWRIVRQAQLTMRVLSADYIVRYVNRNWDEIRYCVGAYQLEAEGARLFTSIDGDYFTVLGLPLLDVLGYLTMSGDIDG